MILHASAGEGHKKVAEAVKEGFLAVGVPEKEILLLDVLEEAPLIFRSLYHGSYYYSVKYIPYLWGLVYQIFDHPWAYRILARPLRQVVNSLVTRRLVRRLLQEKPEAVISTHFLAPEVLGRLKLRRRISSFLLTVVTDYSPHAFWVNPGTDHYWVMSEEGKKDLEKKGIPSIHVTTGGIPVSLRFRPQGKKKLFRKKEGLEPDRFTILVTSGGFGLGPTAAVLDAFTPFKDKVQALVVTGRNRNTFRSLEKRKYLFPLRIYGFVSHMDELMEASDLIIAKPGGATATESLAKGVPLVILDPIPGQESGNMRTLRARNASFLIRTAKDLPIVLKGILDYPEVLEEKRQSMARLAKPEAALELARFVLRSKPVIQ